MKRPPGFSLIEALFAIFVLMVGVVGVLGLFSAGLRARVLAMELYMTQDLATQWVSHVRFWRELPANDAEGDFYLGTGFSEPLATKGLSAYEGYRWVLQHQNPGLRQLLDDGSKTSFNPGGLRQVDLRIARGSRSYLFNFILTDQVELYHEMQTENP